MKIRIIITGILTAFCITSITAGESWVKVIDAEGITVYTRPAAGSSIDEFKGITLIDADPEKIIKVIADHKNLTKWVANCIYAQLITTDNRTSSIIYQQIKSPWPVSDRDVIIRSSLVYEKNRVILYLKSVSDPAVPEKPGIVRIKDLAGTWILEKNGTSTLVSYQIKINPGGSIPASLANRSSRNLPFKTLRGLKKIVADYR